MDDVNENLNEEPARMDAEAEIAVSIAKVAYSNGFDAGVRYLANCIESNIVIPAHLVKEKTSSKFFEDLKESLAGMIEESNDTEGK